MAKKKKVDKGAVAYWTIVLAVATFLTLSIVSCDEQTKMVERTYELVDKTTEIRTHRYLLVENAVETDHILIWKSPTGRIFSVEAGRNSYHRYQVGKRYNFKIDSKRPEEYQIRQFCY